MMESNLFVFQFFCEEDKERVLEGRSWSFDNQTFLLQEMKGDEQPSDVTFARSPFWVHLLDVPFGKRNPSFAYDIGEDLGGFLEYDDSDPLGWEEYMRIKISLDIEKPLRRGCTIANGRDSSLWIGLKHERLGDYCFLLWEAWTHRKGLSDHYAAT